MAHWREALFAAMSRNAGSAADFFKLPANCGSSWARGFRSRAQI
jgi:K+ transporter